jgi:hypothetical protein
MDSTAKRYINHRNVSTHPEARITRALSDQVYRSSAGGPLRDITNTVHNRAQPPTRTIVGPLTVAEANVIADVEEEEFQAQAAGH